MFDASAERTEDTRPVADPGMAFQRLGEPAAMHRKRRASARNAARSPPRIRPLSEEATCVRFPEFAAEILLETSVIIRVIRD